MDCSSDEVDEETDASPVVWVDASLGACSRENCLRSDDQDNANEDCSDLGTFFDDSALRHDENEPMDFRRRIDLDSFDGADDGVHPVIGCFFHSLMSSVTMTDATFH